MNAAAAPWKPIRLLGKHAWASLLGSLVMALATTGAVDAYWSASGTGTGSGPVGTLAAATLSGTAGAGTATLTWTAVTPPGSGTVSYYVQRNGANPAGNCPTSSTASSVLICTDSGLSAGTYSYTVTGVWRTWTATSSTTLVNLASGALHHFLLAVATTTPIAGQADNLTITAKDAAGITVPAYSGSHSLTFSGASSIGAFTPKVTNSGGMATNFGAATAINFTNGVAAVSTGSNGAMTLYKAETVTVSVTDTSISGTSASITVSAAAANRLSFNQSPGNTVAGVAFASQPQVTVQDQYGNTVTTDTSNVTIAVMGGTAAVTGCANTKAASSGVATFSGCTITTAGTYTLTATDGLLISAVSTSFTISPAAASQLAFTTQPGGGTSSTAWATQPTVTVQDAYGNTVTAATASIALAITTPGGAILACTANPKDAAAGVDAFAGCRIDKAGTYTLIATAAGLTGAGSSAFNITVGTATKLAFTAQPGGGANSTVWTNQPTVTVQDAGGNTVTTATTSITVTITTPAGAILTCTPNPKAAVLGVDAFAGCRINKAGTYTLTATSGGYTSAVSNSFIISATVTFSSGPTLAANGYLPTHVSGSGFSGSVTITWSYAWGGYIYSTTTPADGSGNFTWDNYENCIDGYGVYQTTDQTVIVNATDSTHTAIGTGTLLCSLRPRHP